MSKSVVRQGTVTANRHSGGRRPEGFVLQVIDEETRACVEVWFTPEQWALAMWGRGDISVPVRWIGVSPEATTAEEKSE